MSRSSLFRVLAVLTLVSLVGWSLEPIVKTAQRERARV